MTEPSRIILHVFKIITCWSTGNNHKLRVVRFQLVRIYSRTLIPNRLYPSAQSLMAPPFRLSTHTPFARRIVFIWPPALLSVVSQVRPWGCIFRVALSSFSVLSRVSMRPFSFYIARWLPPPFVGIAPPFSRRGPSLGAGVSVATLIIENGQNVLSTWFRTQLNVKFVFAILHQIGPGVSSKFCIGIRWLISKYMLFCTIFGKNDVSPCRRLFYFHVAYDLFFYARGGRAFRIA